MKGTINATVITYFSEDEKEKVNNFVKIVAEQILEKGMNAEIAWDVDHVRLVGRQEFSDEEQQSS